MPVIGRELLTVLPVPLHQIQVVVGEGGVAEKRRQDIGVLLGEGDVRLLAGEGEDPEDLLIPLSGMQRKDLVA